MAGQPSDWRVLHDRILVLSRRPKTAREISVAVVSGAFSGCDYVWLPRLSPSVEIFAH